MKWKQKKLEWELSVDGTKASAVWVSSHKTIHTFRLPILLCASSRHVPNYTTIEQKKTPLERIKNEIKYVIKGWNFEAKEKNKIEDAESIQG